jgi:hypothetical protein
LGAGGGLGGVLSSANAVSDITDAAVAVKMISMFRLMEMILEESVALRAEAR